MKKSVVFIDTVYLLQEIAFKNLVERNKEQEKRSGAPDRNGAIQLPFIIVNTSKKTVIDCSISSDKYVHFITSFFLMFLVSALSRFFSGNAFCTVVLIFKSKIKIKCSVVAFVSCIPGCISCFFVKYKILEKQST